MNVYRINKKIDSPSDICLYIMTKIYTNMQLEQNPKFTLNISRPAPVLDGRLKSEFCWTKMIERFSRRENLMENRPGQLVTSCRYPEDST